MQHGKEQIGFDPITILFFYIVTNQSKAKYNLVVEFFIFAHLIPVNLDIFFQSKNFRILVSMSFLWREEFNRDGFPL
jgi:hypothetical protein